MQIILFSLYSSTLDVAYTVMSFVPELLPEEIVCTSWEYCSLCYSVPLGQSQKYITIILKNKYKGGQFIVLISLYA